MILVSRGLEPDRLREIRLERLPELTRIAQTRAPSRDEIHGYREPVIAAPLWRGQLYKCCYCERKVQCSYHDIEHFRPKTSADRRPGSPATHGYWWLAFTWENLLYACPLCNRSAKNDLFPLDAGSIALMAQEKPPGKEKPLLLDPAETHGVAHIEFVFTQIIPPRLWSGSLPNWEGRKHWWPRARDGSKRGDTTIRACGLDSPEHVELYDDHVNKEVHHLATAVNQAIKSRGDVRRAFEDASRLLNPGQPYVGLSYDALRHLVPEKSLKMWNLAWPEPREVGRSTRRRTKAAKNATKT